MGSFSWLKADDLTEIANIEFNETFKFLIPIEFGGGFIEEKYQDYGLLGTKENGEPKYDMYEILAFWNGEKRLQYGEGLVKESLKYNGEFPLMKEIDEYTDNNRNIGIDIGCYDTEIDQLKYPLKLVSSSFIGTYEDLNFPSYSDPEQGYRLTRSTYRKEYGKHWHV